MVDKSIGELVAASQINDTDLFVLEQSGEAKKLLGNLLKQFITRNVMSVSVSALPPDSEPTVSYDPNTGTLELGIPRGEKGESGESSAGYVSGIVKGDGAGNVSRAIPGTDFAPGGYGLGGNAIHIADWNDAKQNGFYVSSLNGPETGWHFGIVENYDTGVVVQTVFRSSGANVLECKRKFISGTWYPWEWVNPPMQLGVEYRTTERYNGKPVYKKLVDCGSMPDNSTKTVDPNVDNIGNKVSVEGRMYFNSIDNWTLPLHNQSYDADIWFNNIGIQIRTKQTGLTAYTCYAVIKYTKTTD